MAERIQYSLTWILLLTYLVFQPVYKYFEYVNGWAHINISAILFIMLFCLLVLKSLDIDFGCSDVYLMAFVLLVYVTVIQLVSLPWVLEFSTQMTYLKTTSRSLMGYWIFWIIGGYFPKIISSPYYRQILLILWLAVTGAIIANALSNPLAFALILDRQSIYLLLADAYALFTLLLIFGLHSSFFRIIVAIVAMITLFGMWSRTSFYAFLAVFMLYLWQNNRGMLLVTIAALVALFFNGLGDIANERMLRIITGGSDRSLSMRAHILQTGLMELDRVWLLGQFMGDVEYKMGSSGYYIHNYLSFWRQFGLIPFLILVLLAGYNFLLIGLRWIRYQLDTQGSILFYVTTFIVIEIVISRSFLHPYIWFSLAAIPSYLEQNPLSGRCEIR